MSTKTIHGRALVVAPINPTNKYSQAWNVIFGLLEGIDHPDGKVDSDNMPKKWVWGSHPDKVLSDILDASDEEVKSEFPVLAIEPVTPKYDHPTADNKTRDYKFRMRMHILSPRSDKIDSVFDTMAGVLESNETTDYLAVTGIFNFKLSDSDYDHLERAGVKIHTRVLVYEMDFESGM